MPLNSTTQGPRPSWPIFNQTLGYTKFERRQIRSREISISEIPSRLRIKEKATHKTEITDHYLFLFSSKHQRVKSTVLNSRPSVFKVMLQILFPAQTFATYLKSSTNNSPLLFHNDIFVPSWVVPVLQG